MPRLTLHFGGSFLEPIDSTLFFPPLFAKLAQEPTIEHELLKGFAVKVDDFVIGSQLIEAGDALISIAHLELAVLDDRRSPLILEELADRLQAHMREFFARTLASQSHGCYITCDVKLIPAKWHRSVARRAPPIVSRTPLSASRASPIASRASPIASRASPIASRASPIASRESTCTAVSTLLKRTTRALSHLSTDFAKSTRLGSSQKGRRGNPLASLKPMAFHRLGQTSPYCL